MHKGNERRVEIQYQPNTKEAAKKEKRNKNL